MADDVTLFVVFHGSWSFLETQDMIYVKTPDMGDDHVYRAGSWLAENGIRRGALHRFTENLTGDKATTFDRSLNMVTKDAKLSSTTVRGSHATLLFAKPLKIHSLAQMGVPPDAVERVSGDILDQDTSKKMITSALQIFEYAYNSANLPVLEGFQWEPQESVDPATGKMVATLHFFAEHELPESNDEPGSHLVDAYRNGSLLLGADHRLVLPKKIKALPVAQQRELPDPLRLRYLEMEPLASRTPRLAKVGGLMAAGIGKGLDVGQAWDDVPSSYIGFYNVGSFDADGPPDGSDPTCLPNYGGGRCP